MLYHDDGSVKGVATADAGIAKDGSPKVLTLLNPLPTVCWYHVGLVSLLVYVCSRDGAALQGHHIC